MKDRSFHWTPRPLEVRGRRVAIFGGTGGIGRAFAQALTGADVTVIGQTFRDAGRGLTFVQADLSSMAEARRVARALPVETFDLVLFTTGIMAGPVRQETPEGIERDLATSYLNRFVLQAEIAPRLAADRGRGRIFNMAFPGSGQVADVDDLNSERRYARMRAHSNTVAGNEVLVLQGAQDFPRLGVFGLNPGFVRTGIRSNFFGSRLALRLTEAVTGFMTETPEAYVARLAPLLFAPELESRSGLMFSRKGQAILPSKGVTSPDYRRALTEASSRLVAKAEG